MATVSARPDNLAAYRSELVVVDRDLRAMAGRLLHTLEAYRTRCPEGGADHRELAETLRKHATAMEELDGWVGRVGEAFRRADRAPEPAPVGVVRTTDESFLQAKAALDKAFWELAFFQVFGPPDPERVHDWWLNLTPGERDAIIAAFPSPLGNVDGIPCVDRDKANRIVLKQKLDALNAQRQDLAAHEPPAPGSGAYPAVNPDWITWRTKMSALEDQLNGPNAINDRLNRAMPGQPAFLLGLDTEGTGHAIIAINDPDTANNVITYVPGKGARLGSIGGDIDHSDRMVISANKASHGTQVTSSITWVGYDAPQSLPAAVSPRRCEERRDQSAQLRDRPADHPRGGAVAQYDHRAQLR